MTQLLIASSFIFLTNSIATLYFEYYIYSVLFGCLTITSIIFHYNTNIYTNLMDKIFIIGNRGMFGSYFTFYLKKKKIKFYTSYSYKNNRIDFAKKKFLFEWGLYTIINQSKQP